MLVIIGGPGGTGSTTIARILAKKWGLHHIYAGKLMRAMEGDDEKRDINTENLEHSSKDDLDIDEFMVKMSYRLNTLIEGKFFAAIATKLQIPCTLKLWLTADLSTRVKRVMKREGHEHNGKLPPKSSEIYQNTRKRLMQKESEDIRRCRGLYGFDLGKPERFNDIVLDSTGLNVFLTLKKLTQMIKDDKKLSKNFNQEQLNF